MFYVSPSKLTYNPVLTTAISRGELEVASMSYFDRDGYELNELEQAYHIANNIPLGNHLYHTACQANWIGQDIEDQNEGAIIDHSLLLTRYSYDGDARDQLKQSLPFRPVVGKLLKIKQKWGIDFSLDWVTENDVCELLHVEADRYNLDELLEIKEQVELLVTVTDFEYAYNRLMLRKDNWQYLPSDDQDDWKAQFFGFERAFDNRKAY